MSLVIEAIYESGVFKPLAPLPNLKEYERVRLTLEPVSTEAQGAEGLIERQRQRRIQIDLHLAREIGDSHEHDLLGS
jgi:predicted DNA-binding antitoxin AbrB/MazE fold protein